MKVAILNFNTCQVQILSNVPAKNNEEVENILFNELGYNSDEISYMECNHDTKIMFNNVTSDGNGLKSYYEGAYNI